MSINKKWPFDQGPNVGSLTTRQVLDNGFPILKVLHYSDDNSWAFLCGTTNADSDAKVISMAEALELDPSLEAISDLPPGWIAWRKKPGEKWQRAKDKDV
jgi:hypothetical protein